MTNATKTQPITDDLAHSLTEAAVAEQEAAEAAHRAELARERASAARLAAEARQETARQRWADIEIATHADRRHERNAAIAATRQSFEAAVLTNIAAAVPAFTALTAAIAAQHAAEGSYVLGQSLKGRDVRTPTWPDLRFTAEVDGILARHAHGQLDTATETEKHRRLAAITGQETTS
jgi:hypothetical protein